MQRGRDASQEDGDGGVSSVGGVICEDVARGYTRLQER